jgi:hypothetical protein
MISDAIYIYNREFRPLGVQDEVVNFEQMVLIKSLSLFRFWKFQTGGGVVVDRSSDFVKKWRYITQFDKEVKPILENNMKFEPMGLAHLYPDREEQLRILINQKVRDNRLNNILN